MNASGGAMERQVRSQRECSAVERLHQPKREAKSSKHETEQGERFDEMKQRN